jgi:hypothetical protein
MYGQDGNAALVEFCFASRATDNLPASALLRIARQAWQFNSRFGLTGELRLESRRFLQVVEGPCDVILPLASRILTDQRHGGIEVLAFRSIAMRRFAAWTALGFGAPNGAMHSGFAAPQHLCVLPLPETAGARSAQGARLG